MTRYFNEFPLIKYDGKVIRDITRKVKLRGVYTENVDAYLPYTIESEDKPEDIANLYYGSVDYTWLVCLCNNVIDPYSDWVLSNSNFEKMLMKKYATLSGKFGYEIVNWCMNSRITENIKYYFKDGVFFSNDTMIEKFREDSSINHSVAIMDSAIAQGYKAIRIYEEENEINERKRNIVLLDKSLLSRATDEFVRLMRE